MIKIKKLEKIETNQMGDNYLDHLVTVDIDSITHRVWVSCSGSLMRTEKKSLKDVSKFINDKLEKSLYNDISFEHWLGNQGDYAAPYVVLKAGNVDKVVDDECFYHEYPRLIFTTPPPPPAEPKQKPTNTINDEIKKSIINVT